MLRFAIFMFLGFGVFTTITFAQVNLKACGVDKSFAGSWMTKNCNNTKFNKSYTSGQTSLNKVQDNIVCNRISEGNNTYLLEGKRRGLACAVENDKNNINVKNNSSSTFSSKSYSSSSKNFPDICRNFNYTLYIINTK